ncbi:S26 family signal peptidase, partial [Pontiella sp.]|uniref:S26 family signal peptidase n=1 Tax=Pontiella sp. TaxID=2837462 RepID=UPI0035618A1D
MIGILKKRKLRKQLKEYLNMARHARHMREDIANPKDLEALLAAEAVVRDIRKAGGSDDLDEALARLEVASDKVYPNENRTGIRENVEVIIVALGAAMAIRAFFFQPFKIPTGSMQPTHNGITTEMQLGGNITDKQPIKFFKWLVTGTSYKEYRATVSGPLENLREDRDKIIVTIGGVDHKLPSFMREFVYEQVEHRARILIPQTYRKGDVIASAKVIAGDHILVNKLKYNFMSPERGDIAVFDTRHID